MGTRCRFCGQGFKNKQAVRAHLRWCEAKPEQRTIGSEPGSEARQSQTPRAEVRVDPVDPLWQEVRREEARLKLREVQAAHKALDEREAEAERKARARADALRQEARARRLAEEEAEEEARERALLGEQARKDASRRKSVLWTVTTSEIEQYVPPSGVVIPREITERALAEIDRVAARIPIDGLEYLRVLAAARQIRERLYGPEIRRQLESRERIGPLVQDGLAYARGEIEAGGSLDRGRFPEVVSRLEADLRKRLTGEETEEQLEDLVDGLLEQELGRI